MQKRVVVNTEYDSQKKTRLAAWLLWFFLGAFGGHRFYLGSKGLAVLYIFTGGLFVVGIIVDIFLINGKVRKHNRDVYYKLCAAYGVAPSPTFQP